jgi:hypothetical protein
MVVTFSGEQSFPFWVLIQALGLQQTTPAEKNIIMKDKHGG